MRVVVHQPQFMPWIGFWAKMAAAEKFVIYAGVKFDKTGKQHRVELWKDHYVGAQIGSSMCLIRDMEVTDHRSLRKLAKTLYQTYCNRKHKYHDRIMPLVLLFENWDGRFLLDLDVQVMACMMQALPFMADIVIDREDRSGGKEEKLLDCLNRHGGPACDYYMGGGGLSYMDFDSLPGHRIYVQRMAEGVSPYSIVELLATVEDPVSVIEASCCWEGKTSFHRIEGGQRIQIAGR